jgi:hypothetical protein
MMGPNGSRRRYGGFWRAFEPLRPCDDQTAMKYAPLSNRRRSMRRLALFWKFCDFGYLIANGAEADTDPIEATSPFDPTETLVAKSTVMHDAIFPATLW